jgi:UDP-N-acetylglucosamine--N-acetylmuramyl-(pentapeptide) pyrophosphoryl-undecaprenol N-acetylglucosamine transferase
MECERVPAAEIPLDVVRISGLRGKGMKGWLTGPWKLLRSVYQASRLIGKHRPFCAISFGGYAAGPGGLAARLRGVPLLVHEQNRVPGMTNRALSRFAACVLQAFPGTWSEALGARTCGNPVRRDLLAVEPPEFRLRDRRGPVRILLTGGSQGARFLNQLLPEALSRLSASLPIEVRHQAGKGRRDATLAAYQEAGVEAQVFEFIDDMADALNWADLIVCRAGALTVSEIAAVGIAAILVPFPHAVDDHQTRNAEFLVEAGAALLVQEADIDPRGFADLLRPLLADRERLLEMARRARALAVPDSADQVANACTEYRAA